LLAHELVHTVQQGDAASKPQLKGTQISEAGDAAELEADHIARVALSGGEPTGAPIERAAPVARVPETLSGNPAELTDSTGAATTTHRAAGLGDAANPPTATAAATESRTANVQVKADASSKLHLEPPVCPLPSRIYEEDASAASPAPAGFQTVTGLNGTVAAPIVTQEANKSLYINGQPTADDVQQAGIGDCYFLAAVMSVVSRDPGKITSMISPDGNGGGTVMFWRAQTHAPTILERIMGGAPERDWIQVAVTVNDTLAFDIANNQVHGAQLRCAPGPKAADYWGDVQGTTLEIHRHDEFECARWAPILEKAYALFSQNHSNNGGARPNGTTGASGYDAINGGWSYEALCVFYGPQSDAAGADLKQQDTNFNPGAASQVVANAPVMEQLALLQGRGTQTRPGETDAPIVTATSSVAPLIGRLTAAIPVAQADADYANVDAGRQASVGTVATSVATYNATPPDPAGVPGPEAAALAAIGNACVDAVAPGLTESSGRAEVMRNITGWNPSPITFGSGDDVVPPAAATDLGNMNSWMISNRHPQVAIQIDGHSSTVGDAATNQDLSQRRADNVETALVAGGAIAPHTSAKTAHGEAGATADPAWQKVVVGVTHTGHNTNTLLDPLRSTPIRQMTDLMLDLRNIGTDSSSGQRNIYGDHVYSVVGVNIVTTSGVTVPLNAVPAQFRSLLYPLVDGDVSTVLLRNPHHGNEPDRMDSNTPSRPGDGAPSEAGSDGNFTMSLNEFFLNFTAVDSGVFPRS
jgi:outer membrane protein OmpA-like peptidoglycan-associated protein